ncbi:hypothetical protein ACWELB_36865 [Streptomyces asiaticus]|uniref:hypothetical protein n=1 Tax=Streptomyces asiaticus TaxID=114695 RepID=UPI003D7103CC
MGLRDEVRRAALGRPHVLLADVAGATETRLSVERELRRLGWPSARSPSSADLLVVVGEPGSEQDALLRELFGDVPRPRARVAVRSPHAATAALREGHLKLLTGEGGGTAEDGSSGGHSGHEDRDGEMTVAGLPMAERADDRDGLRLDRLHVPLGPVLPD